MNLLLSNFSDENSKDLSELLISYQEYFTFEKKGNETCLYLDIHNLKKYLIEGKEIKYRKFIFLFLENIVLKKKGKNYNFNYNKHYKSINNLINNKILDNHDLKNLNKIISIIHYLNNNFIRIKNNNIYSLDNNLYADIKNKRFLNQNFLEDYKYNFRINGFIINNKSYLKNVTIILNSIKNSNNHLRNENKLKNMLLDTQCSLIITSKIKMELFINLLKSINKDVKYIEINKVSHFSDYKNKDINNYDYLFVNINLINNYLKFFDKDYNNNINYELNDLINNILIEQMINEELINSEFTNLFLFNWNNLIIDNYLKINKNDIHYLKHLNIKNYKYINFENNIDELILKNMSVFLINIDDLQKYGYNNFKNIIKNELLIKNINYNSYDNHEIINIENNEESEILSKLNYNKNSEIELANFFIKSTNKFVHKDNINNIKNLIISEENNNPYLNNINNLDNNTTFCCICMERIDKSKLCILGCCHYFCKTCILMHKINEELNNYQNKCPICRYNYNIIYNISEKKEKFNKVMNNLNKILDEQKDKKILIVAEYNQILEYIKDELKDDYNISSYKKNNNLNENISLISINYLKKTIIKNIDIFIFFTFSIKGYQKYIEIKNIYNDYYLNKNKIKFYLFNYNKK